MKQEQQNNKIMNITTELLESIYTRAIEFATTKYGSAPDRIEIEEGGTLLARWTSYRRDDDDETEYISPEDLTADLEEVAKERAKKLEEEKIKQQERQRAEQVRREINEKNQRRATYEKLKKEFES